jgi:Tol biopolymer transport system component
MSWKTTALAVLTALVLVALCAPGTLAKKPAPPDPEPDPDPAIVYTTTVRSVTKLMVMNADGSNGTEVLDAGSARLGWPSFSPDGTQIVFASDIQGSGVYVVSVDGTGLRKVVAQTDPNQLGRPAWSPAPVPGVGGNKVRIAYTDRAVGADRPDIYLIDVDGTDTPIRLLSTPDRTESWPTWSPSATRLVCRVPEFGVNDQWGLYDFTTGTFTVARHQGPLAGAHVYQPVWSKTREDKIAWLAFLENGYQDVWIVDLDDPAQPLNLTATSDITERSISWAPDDAEILVSSAVVKKNGIGDVVFEVMSAADGSNRRVLLEGKGLVAPFWRR